MRNLMRLVVAFAFCFNIMFVQVVMCLEEELEEEKVIKFLRQLNPDDFSKDLKGSICFLLSKDKKSIFLIAIDDGLVEIDISDIDEEGNLKESKKIHGQSNFDAIEQPYGWDIIHTIDSETGQLMKGYQTTAKIKGKEQILQISDLDISPGYLAEDIKTKTDGFMVKKDNFNIIEFMRNGRWDIYKELKGLYEMGVKFPADLQSNLDRVLQAEKDFYEYPKEQQQTLAERSGEILKNNGLVYQKMTSELRQNPPPGLVPELDWDGVPKIPTGLAGLEDVTLPVKDWRTLEEIFKNIPQPVKMSGEELQMQKWTTKVATRVGPDGKMEIFLEDRWVPFKPIHMYTLQYQPYEYDKVYFPSGRPKDHPSDTFPSAKPYRDVNPTIPILTHVGVGVGAGVGMLLSSASNPVTATASIAAVVGMVLADWIFGDSEDRQEKSEIR